MRFFKLFLLSLMMMSFISISALASWHNDEISVGQETVKLSKNVKADYKAANPSTSSGTDYQTYSAASYNAAGTRIYAVASGSPKFKYKECSEKPCAKVSSGPDNPVSNGDSSDLSSWGSDL